MYYLYILECNDHSLYTGIAKDVKKRMKIHQQGTGSKYVRSRLPFRLIYLKEFQDKSSALKQEIEIKKLNRQEKLLLISRNSFHLKKVL